MKLKQFVWIIVFILLIGFAYADYGVELNLTNVTASDQDYNGQGEDKVFDNNPTTRTGGRGESTLRYVSASNGTNAATAEDICYSNLSMRYIWFHGATTNFSIIIWNSTTSTYDQISSMLTASGVNVDWTFNRTICTRGFNFTVTSTANIDGGVFFINGSKIANPNASISPDTTPPNILHYNLSTPSGDCTVWNTSKSTPCSTGDTTPTISIRTDDSSDCAIGLLDKNFTHYNNLSVNRTCEKLSGTSHICTLRSQDELTYQDSTVYIGCRNSGGYENSTSTSGTLSITITGLEAGTQAAIGVGVQNALLSGYTNYTDQQIYARKLDGNQKKGIFDWVAKKGSKVWAFNYITAGEEHVGMFNMSPSFYVLEMSNITNSTIINFVELAINATK